MWKARTGAERRSSSWLSGIHSSSALGTDREADRRLKNEGNDLFPSLQQTDKTEDMSKSSLTDTGLIDKTAFSSWKQTQGNS